MALAYSDLTAFTDKWIVPRITDVIFKRSPLFTRMMSKQRMKFPGGLFIQRPITYAELNGDWFQKGAALSTAYVPTDTAFNLNIKQNYVTITLFGTDDILNRGENAAFSIVESKFANASMKMAKLIAVSLYQDGQSSVNPPYTGALSGTLSTDGLLAWVDDGNTGYTANTDQNKSFASIGGVTRSDLFTTAPVFSGPITPISAVQGANSYCIRQYSAFTLPDINTAYGAAWFGPDYTDLIPTTQTGYNKIWNSLQPQQRYFASDSDIGKVGFNNFRFNQAEVVIDKYIPSDGTNGLMLGLNTNYLEFYISDNPKFQFGFTGFKESQGSIDVTGQFLFAGNLVSPNSRCHWKIIGPALF